MKVPETHGGDCSPYLLIMGRARNLTHASAVKEFNNVLGRHRGLDNEAHASRDAELAHQQQVRDEEARELSFRDFAWAVAGAKSSDAPFSGVVNILGSAYAAGAHLPGSAGHKQLLEDILNDGGSVTMDEQLATILLLGDPVGWPGLTAPVVEAASRYFAGKPGAFGAHWYANTIFMTCFQKPHDQDYYRRLQPLCEALGSFMFKHAKTEASSDTTYPWRNLISAIEASAPTGALTRDLSSWVKAMERRISYGDNRVQNHDNSSYSRLEMGAIDSVIIRYQSDPVAAAALAPLAAKLKSKSGRYWRRG